MKTAIVFVLNCVYGSLLLGSCNPVKFERDLTEASSPPPSILDFLTPFRPTITVSKFPMVIEVIAQRIQAQFSNYIYEDLSRPQTWDRPTYKPIAITTTTRTRKPAHAIGVQGNANGSRTTTEKLFIPTVAPPTIILVDSYELIQHANFNSSLHVEYELKQLGKMHSDSDDSIANILNDIQLQANSTRIFQVTPSIDGHTNTYNEVSTLFLDMDNHGGSVSYLLRHNSAQNIDKQPLITFTKFGHRVYANTIELRLSKTLNDQGQI